MIVLANQLYGMPMPGNLLSLFLFVCVSAAAFRALGLIIAAVVNSSQEANILIQLIYMPMLFLSGATFPLSFMPNWLQIVTQFIPATYLVTGMAGILEHGESLWQNSKSVGALIITMFVALFIATKLFRREKEEKLRASAKLWVLVAFIALFFYWADLRSPGARAGPRQKRGFWPATGSVPITG